MSTLNHCARGVFVLAAVVPCGSVFAGGVAVHISEIRIDQPSTDIDEYFELSGPPGTSLTGLWYVVIGDGAAGSGVIESVTSLDAQTIPADGRFIACETSTLLIPAAQRDLVLAGGSPGGLNFENSDNVTHVLVSGFTGTNGQDLDTNDDGALDIMPWTGVVDLIALVLSPNPPTLTEYHYGPPAIGPDGTFVPSHVYRGGDCGDWQLGLFELPPTGFDTPGAINPDCPPPPADYFFGLATQPLGGAILIHGAAGEMIIDNIGSSGQDGVSIALSEPNPAGAVTPGWDGEVDFGPGGGLSAGARFVIRTRDQFDNPIQALQIDQLPGGGAGVSATQDVCAPCSMTVQALLDGAVVASTTLTPPFPPLLARGNFGSSAAGRVKVRFPWLSDHEDDVWMLSNPTVISIGLTGQPPVDGNGLRVSLNGLPPGTRYIGNLQITSSNTGPITVHSESLLAHELTHVVQQAAHMRGIGDLDGDGRPDLVVDNLGADGDDGLRLYGRDVLLVYDQNDSLSVEADWGQGGSLPPASSVTWTIDTQGPIIDDFALIVSETGGGQGAVSMSVCNPCTNSSFVVQATHHGVLVDQVSHSVLPPTLAVGNIGSSGGGGGGGALNGVTFAAGPRQTTSQDGSFSHRLDMSVRSGAPGTMTLTGSPIGAVTADRITVRVANPDGTDLLTVRSAALRAGNVSSFTVIDGRVSVANAVDTHGFGLPMTTLGDASISPSPTGGLTVANIGSSGQDGVSIDLGDDAQGWRGEIDLGPAGGLPNGARLTVRNVGNTTDTFALSITGASNGAAMISVNQDVCNPCMLNVELLLDGHVVGSATYPPPYPPALVTGNIGSSGGNGVSLTVTVTDLTSGVTGPPSTRLHNSIATAMTLAGQAPVDADCVRISLNGLPPGTPVEGVSSIDITGDGLSSFDIDACALIAFNQTHNQTGSGRMRISSGQPTIIDNRLTVSNIGSSGQDGVSIEPPDEDCDGTSDLAERFAITTAPIILPPGSNMAIKTKGTGAQDQGASFFDVFVELEVGSGPSGQISIDLSDFGSPPYTVQIYQGGTLVLAQPNQTGSAVASVPANAPLNRFGTLRQLIGGATSLTSRLAWSTSIPITLTGGLSATGDELRIVFGAGIPTTGLNSIDLRAANLTGGTFTLLDETVVLINPCPADISPVPNGDGAVNVNDLLLVVGNWGATGANPADVNGDNVVDVNDLLAVVGAWGPCP